MEDNMRNAVLLMNCTLDDIERMIDRAIAKRMRDFYESLRQKPPVLVKRKEAAAMLGVSTVTLDKYAKFKLLHVRHVGGRCFYELDELEHYQQHPPKTTSLTINGK